MVEKHRKMIGGVIVVALIFSGCAQKPNATVQNGILYADEENSKIQSIIDEVEDNMGDVSSNLKEATTEKDDHLVLSVGKDHNILKIDAYIKQPQKETISSITVSRSVGKTDQTKLIQQLLGGEENARKIVDADAPTETIWESLDGEKKIQLSASDFLYSNNLLGTQYKKTDMGECHTELDKDISGEYTVADATEEIVEFFREVADTEIAVSTCEATYNDDGEGYYTVRVSPVIAGIPLDISGSTNSDQISAEGYITIGKDGIADILTNDFFWKISENSDTGQKCMNVSQAVKVVEQYIEQGLITCTDKVTFRKVYLAWLPEKDENKSIRLIPVWKFYLPNEQIDESGKMDISTAREQGAQVDICINAITGEIEKLQL